MKVRTEGNKPAKPPAAVNYAEIEGQGRVPYAKEKSMATPETAKGHDLPGKSRGMGAALRGGSFHCT
jgi:hypothetical protein